MAQKMIRLLMEESGKKKKSPSAAASQAGKAQSKSTSQSKKQALVEAKLAATVKTKPSRENLVAKHGQNASLMVYDLDAGKKEIQTLENAIRQRQRDASLARTRSAAQNTYLGAPVKQEFDFVRNLAETKALQQELTRKRTAYNQAKRYQETAAYEDTLRHDDFGRFADYTPSDDPLHNWINDPAYRESYETQYGKSFQTAFQDSPYTGRKESPFTRSGYDRMSESEIAIYNYYYEKEGKDAAGKYLDSIQETLNGRTAQDLYGTVAGNTGLEMLFGAAAGADRFESGVRSAFNFGDDYITRTPYEIASESVREDLADDGGKLPDWLGGASLGQVAYDTIGVAANMAPSMLVSAATGIPMAGNAVMGISAAGNAYKQALNEGFDKGQAKGYGILVGASEVVLEKCLGGISAYGGNKLGKAAVENLTNVDEALKMVAKTLGGGVSEFREEYLQEVLDPVLRNIALKTDEEVDLLSPEALYSGILGALTGSAAEVGDITVNGLGDGADAVDHAAENIDSAVDGSVKGMEAAVDGTVKGMDAADGTAMGMETVSDGIAERTDAAVADAAGRDAQAEAPVQAKEKEAPSYWAPWTAVAKRMQEKVQSAEQARVDTIGSIKGITSQDAEKIIGILKNTDSASVEMDALGAREAYLYGYYGIPDGLMTGQPYYYTNLSDADQQAIYDIGRQARDAQIEQQWQRAKGKMDAAVQMRAESFEAEEAAAFDADAAQLQMDADAELEADAAMEPAAEDPSVVGEVIAPEAEIAQTEADLDVEKSAKGGIMGTDGDTQSLMATNKRIPNAKERSRVINEAINLELPVYAEELRSAYKGVKPKAGFMDICLHGTPHYTTYEHRYRLDTETLYLIISGRKEFQKQNIRLLSCSTGNADRYGNCVAQELADLLGVDVYAPIDTLFISNGMLTVCDKGLS